MNGFLNRYHVRRVVFGTFPTIDDQRWANKAHVGSVVLAVEVDGIQQVRVVLPDPAIDDAEYLPGRTCWIPHSTVAGTDHISQEGIFANKEMVCKVY